MGLYRCLWPDGDVSFVMAKDKDDALFLLDEFGGAGEEMLTEVGCGDFMVTFTPTCEEEEDGEEGEYGWALSESGERTIGEDGPLDWELAKKCWAASNAPSDDDDDDDDEKEEEN